MQPPLQRTVRAHATTEKIDAPEGGKRLAGALRVTPTCLLARAGRARYSTRILSMLQYAFGDQTATSSQAPVAGKANASLCAFLTGFVLYVGHCRAAGAGKGNLEASRLAFVAAPPFAGFRGEKSMSKRLAPQSVQLRAQAGGEENVVEKYRQILANIDGEAVPARKSGNLFSKMLESAKGVKTCETDYDCNPGGRNWPLRCVNVVFSKICVESDDDMGGGRGIMEYALETIPVRVEDGYYGNGASNLP